MIMKIDFSKYMDKGVKVLSGRDKGQEMRKNLNLDKVDFSDELVDVFIPDIVYSINSSFFLGFFGPSVRFLTEEKFRGKYIFHCDAVLMKNVDDGIARALKESDALRR